MRGVIMAKKKYYAVKKGHSTGVFNSWDECKPAVEGFSGAEYKSFESEAEANAYLEDVDIVMENDVIPRINEGRVVAFTDGSFDATKNKYGSGVCIFAPNHESVELSSWGNNQKYTDLRNVAGEIIAVLNAVDWAWKNGYEQMSIFYDYEGIGKWASGDWKPKTTLSSYYKRYIDDKNGIISIEFVKVSGHSNNKYNDRADKLAQSAVFENKVIRDVGGNSGYIISPVSEASINTLLSDLKEECVGLDYSFCKVGNKKCWTVTFGAEKIQISLYNDIKMTVQGKKSNLFQIVTTGVIETIQCGDFIQVLRNAYGISIDSAKVDVDYTSALPIISREVLPTNISTLIKQAIVNLNNPARSDSEFSMYVFPVLRALEGVLKYNLKKCGITMASTRFDMFSKDSSGLYKLRPEHSAVLSLEKKSKLENCYNWFYNNRHTLFHFGIIVGESDVNTRLLNSKAEADGMIRDTLKVIDENYIS